MRLVLTASGAVMLLSPAAASAEVQSCPGYENGKAEPVAINEFYARRAISVLSAALHEDRAVLDELLAADAKFELWRGDYASSARSGGSLGAIEMARDLRPNSFQLQTAQPGPVHYVLAECSWDVTVLFRSEEPTRAVSVKFSFRDGLMESAVGHEVALLEGSMR